MKIVTAHCPTMPEELTYRALKDGTAEVWIRKNIEQTTVLSESAGGGGDNLEYIYNEVYFRTTASQEEIEADINGFWLAGQEWEPDVPLTPTQKQEIRIATLEKQLETARTELEQSRTDNDMAIAELTMVMAAMMGGE